MGTRQHPMQSAFVFVDGKRKISDTQRIINFGYNAEEAELNQAIESLTALRNNRFPKQAKAATARKPRKPRTAQSPPPAASASEPSSFEN